MYLFNTDPKLEGSHEDKIDIVLELLKELKMKHLLNVMKIISGCKLPITREAGSNRRICCSQSNRAGFKHGQSGQLPRAPTF